MTVTRILNGLEKTPATGAEAERAARDGFLQWVVAAPGAATPQAARAALAAPAARNASSAAARTFVGFLEQASRTPCRHAAPRRGGRGRRMH